MKRSARENTRRTAGKPRVDLVPPEAIVAMATVLGFGASKHGERDWERGYPWSRYYASLLRHLLAWKAGEDVDPESGRPHLWHALCNLSFLVTYGIRGIGDDDR